MLMIRPVCINDLEDLLALASKAGSGMTSLPTCPETMSANIARSVKSFASVEKDYDDYFLLVMEDTARGRVVGTAGVYSHTGARQAFYAYRIIPMTHYSHSLNKRTHSDMLQLCNDYTACSEVGTLFIDPQYRGNGHWLAKARYLFMGCFSHRFESHVIAELRGWLDREGNSPVWEAVGRHFFDMDFEEADSLCGKGSNQFITELMPKYPIYTCLLPELAQKCIGKPNDSGRRALELLEMEGFEYDKVVDIFDGGPLVKAKVKQLRTIRHIRNGYGRKSDNKLQGGRVLVANNSLSEFRAVYTLGGNGKEGEIALSHEEFEALLMDQQSPLFYVNTAVNDE